LPRMWIFVCGGSGGWEEANIRALITSHPKLCLLFYGNNLIWEISFIFNSINTFCSHGLLLKHIITRKQNTQRKPQQERIEPTNTNTHKQQQKTPVSSIHNFNTWWWWRTKQTNSGELVR
jgi:hypothetical protein